MNVTALGIKPMSFGVEQRVEAAIKAAVMGRGVHMEVGNSTTRFYADDSVPVGHIRITAPPKYKAVPEYVRTLTSPLEPYDPWAERAANAVVGSTPEGQTP